ncbi:MAG TPA: CDP-alcohol phosphatidyltransferase family protein [Polyangiaceae bacterium]
MSVPGLLSLLRVPLAVAFPFVVHEPAVALSLLAAAALSDVLDGWYARAVGRATPAGAILDPIMDKIFVVTVVVTLVVAGMLPIIPALLLGARDLAELPLAVWFVVAPRDVAVRAREIEMKANVFGKIATVFQFATLSAALVEIRGVLVLAVATGAVGLVAAFSYWVRGLQGLRLAGSRGGRPGGPSGSVTLERPARGRN